MNRCKVITGIMLIFVVGALSGALGTGFYTKSQIKRLMDPFGPPPPIRILEHQLDELNLTSEQQRKTDAVLEQMHAGFIEVFQKTKPEMEEHFNRHAQLLRTELTPEQQRPFDITIQRIQERIKQLLSPPVIRNSLKVPLPELETELSLTPEEARRCENVVVSMEKRKDEILGRWVVARERLHKTLRTDLEALMDETEGELAGFLSAEQAKRVREAYSPSRLERHKRPLP